MDSVTTAVYRVRVRAQNTRKNFPAVVARKRGESLFLRKFERAYFAKRGTSGLAAGEFALSNYGVADLVWIAWRRDAFAEDFSALSLEKELTRRNLFAFEAKLTDWRKALHQAFRYRYFADKAIVVMPAENIAPAVEHLNIFRDLEVGLWSFDASTGKIREHFTPTKVKARNIAARQKAITLMLSKINLRKLRK